MFYLEPDLIVTNTDGEVTLEQDFEYKVQQ